MIAAILIAAAVTAAPPTFELKTLDGKTVTGSLAEADVHRVVLDTGAGRTPVNLDQLLSLRPLAGVQNAAPPAVRATLVDGTVLAAKSYEVKSGTATVVLMSGEKVSVPTTAVRTVLLATDLSPELAAQWSQIAAQPATADLLVVNKKQSLDYLEGVLEDVLADRVRFKQDDQTLSVKRERIAGFAYYHKHSGAAAEPLGVVLARDGSRMAIAQLRVAGDALAIATPGGLKFSVPLADVTQIDFSGGKIEYLSDLEPESAQYTPYLGLKNDVDALSAFYRPRRNASFSGEGLEVGGQKYAKGLSLVSRSRMAFRLSGRYRRLAAVVGIDDRVDTAGRAKVEILGDGRSLWMREVAGAARPETLDVDVAGVKRLEVVVDYADGWDVGDQVNLCDARVTK